MTDGTPRTFTWPPKTIVAAVDFGEASDRAISLAGVIAAAGAGTLRVLHAERFEVPPYFTPAQIDRLEDERKEATAEITTELTRFAKTATTWPTTIVVADGRPLDVILAQSADADLLVLGTHGRRGPSRWWLGSVAERVVRAADVPVLVTRADATPAADLFARVVVVGDDAAPDQATRVRVEALASAQGGQIVASDTLAACGSDTVATATLVAVAVPHGRSGWALSDVVTDALGHCARPVLFLPAP
jgi:nucleotide-binding universal stress UspA family protein